MRQYVWLAPILVAFVLIGYFVYKYGVSGRQAAAEADALVADLNAHGAEAERTAAALADLPIPTTGTEFHYQLNQISDARTAIRIRASELRDRAEQVLPRAPKDERQQVSEALSRYVERLVAANDVLQRRTDELQTKIDKLLTPPNA